MQIKKATYFILILILASFTGLSQMSLSFSPIAFSNSGVTAAGGSSIIINGSSKCLTTGNGLNALTIVYNNKGAFAESCKEVAPVANITNVSVSLKLYPNPTNGPVTLKCEGQFDANLYSQIRITSMDGRTMFSQLVLMRDIQSGYLLNVAAYPAGTYAVSIDFMNQRYNSKLIKM